MLKFKILSVGKTKETWLKEALAEYEKRLKPILTLEYLWAKDDQQLIEWSLKEPLSLLLDPSGQLLSSEQFAAFLTKESEKGGARLTFVIGGAEGLPSELTSQRTLISLSPMTFTHQMTRLILVEQIYRATQIQKGSSYHK